MYAADLIRKTRDRQPLSASELQFLVHGAADSSIPDYQLSAWLMAAWLNGITRQELADLTLAMRISGEVLDPSSLGRFAVDKHSTGGVGDKTSFLVAPIAACAGLVVPMISGRALGHTGGTLDKLESIPGYNTRLTLDEMLQVLANIGCSIVGQTENLVPADRKLYSLRDVTATVESPDLICASIMSKKLAAGLDGLVLDVKTGSGAFLRTESDANYLAALMVSTGEAAGTRTVACITSMEQPLGRFAGNYLEIWESIDLLSNRRHPLSERLRELSLILAGWMLHLGGAASSATAGYALAEEFLVSGAALEKFLSMVQAQGGEAAILGHPASFHSPGAQTKLRAARSGYISAMDTTAIGWAVQRLGAGRAKASDMVSAHAGLEMHVQLGSKVTAGEPLVTLFSDDIARLGEPERLLAAAIVIGDSAPEADLLVRRILHAGNFEQYATRT